MLARLHAYMLTCVTASFTASSSFSVDSSPCLLPPPFCQSGSVPRSCGRASLSFPLLCLAPPLTLTTKNGQNGKKQKVPRTYHNGVKGTFMDQATHDRRFKNIDYNVDASFSWTSPPRSPAAGSSSPHPVYAKVTRDNYERRVEARIQGARHINNLEVSEEGGLGAALSCCLE